MKYPWVLPVAQGYEGSRISHFDMLDHSLKETGWKTNNLFWEDREWLETIALLLAILLDVHRITCELVIWIVWLTREDLCNWSEIQGR